MVVLGRPLLVLLVLLLHLVLLIPGLKVRAPLGGGQAARGGRGDAVAAAGGGRDGVVLGQLGDLLDAAARALQVELLGIAVAVGAVALEVEPADGEDPYREGTGGGGIVLSA